MGLNSEGIMEDKKICPLMSTGWMSNAHATKINKGITYIDMNELPICQKERCQLWENNKCSFNLKTN